MISYGGNFTHYAPSPPASGEQPGVIFNYHLVRALCQWQLGRMRANGHTSIQLDLFGWAAEENFSPDGFTLPVNTDGSLDPQRMTNVQDLLADIKAVGFGHVSMFCGGEGLTLGASNWPAEIGDRWMRPANWIANMRGLLVSLGIPYSIDLGEPGSAYAQTLWAWYTDAFGTEDSHHTVTDAQFEVSNPDDARALPGTYRGSPDPNAVVNWSRSKLSLGVYGEQPGAGLGSAYSVYCASLDAYLAAGGPADIPVEIVETFPPPDFTTTCEILRAAKDRPQMTLERILFWPNVRDAHYSDNELAAPVTAGLPAWMLG